VDQPLLPASSKIQQKERKEKKREKGMERKQHLQKFISINQLCYKSAQ
jgi:hypothetical protein